VGARRRRRRRRKRRRKKRTGRRRRRRKRRKRAQTMIIHLLSREKICYVNKKDAKFLGKTHYFPRHEEAQGSKKIHRKNQ